MTIDGIPLNISSNSTILAGVTSGGFLSLTSALAALYRGPNRVEANASGVAITGAAIFSGNITTTSGTVTAANGSFTSSLATAALTINSNALQLSNAKSFAGTTGLITLGSASGGHALSLTPAVAGAVAVQLPASGVLATLANVETLDNKTLTNSPNIGATAISTGTLSASGLSSLANVNISGTLDINSQITMNPTTGAATFNGEVTAPSFNATSALSLKTEVNEFTESAMNILKQIRIHSYRFKRDNAEVSPERVGIIADYVKDPRVSGVKHDRFEIANVVGLLVKAVQELSDRIQ
jgi:hypothetical protein